jgi:hypothetical protein
MACSPNSAIESIPIVQTTTKAINAENGTAWLGIASVDSDILSGKSAFKLFQAHGEGVYGHPPNKKIIDTLNLTLRGKTLHDPQNALVQVERRVGTGEVELGCCSLCFENIKKGSLVAACGRHGCSEKVDDACLQEWVSSFTHWVL